MLERGNSWAKTRDNLPTIFLLGEYFRGLAINYHGFVKMMTNRSLLHLSASLVCRSIRTHDALTGLSVCLSVCPSLLIFSLNFFLLFSSSFLLIFSLPTFLSLSFQPSHYFLLSFSLLRSFLCPYFNFSYFLIFSSFLSFFLFSLSFPLCLSTFFPFFLLASYIFRAGCSNHTTTTSGNNHPLIARTVVKKKKKNRTP